MIASGSLNAASRADDLPLSYNAVHILEDNLAARADKVALR